MSISCCLCCVPSNLDYEPIDVSSHKLLAALIYVMYCMTTTILLLNLLIAIMSDRYDRPPSYE